jgi:hypothetical protein
VETPGGIKSGSSVIDVRIQKQPEFGSSPPIVTYVKGEAVFVDLGDGRNLIALLASGPNAENTDYPKSVVPTHFRLSYEDHDLVKYPSLQGRWDVPERYLPTFVTFEDLYDPKTTRVVPPHALEEVFGAGVRLRRVWVEMTGDLITRRIEKEMPQIIQQLRERAQGMQMRRVGDPYFARLGQFYIGD